MSLDTVISALKRLGNDAVAQAKDQKFGIAVAQSLGIYQKDINELARSLNIPPEIALDLIESDLYEARILGYKTFPPTQLTHALAQKWVQRLSTWEDCDTFSMKLVSKSNIGWDLIFPWMQSEEPFIKRAGFASLAALCMSDKKASNDAFIEAVESAMACIDDDRIYVRKGVSWAFRNVGKRNPDLKGYILEKMTSIPKASKPVKWIITDVCSELTKPNVRTSNYPRSIYGS